MNRGWEPIVPGVRLSHMGAWTLGGAVSGVMTLALAACGGIAGSGIGPSPSGPTGAPASVHTVVLNESDAGRSINVHKGDRVEVQLQDSFPVPGSATRWEASSTDSKVLRLVRSQHQAPTSIAHGHASYIADFAVDAAGAANVVIVGHKTCEGLDPDFCKDATLPAISVTVG